MRTDAAVGKGLREKEASGIPLPPRDESCLLRSPHFRDVKRMRENDARVSWRLPMMLQ